MVKNEFAEAATEFNMLVKYMPMEYIENIPKKLRDFLNEVESKSYLPNIDYNKTLEQQELKEKTKDLITVIYRNYWCDKEKKSKIDQKLIENDKNYEEELRKKYDPNNIFKNQKQNLNEKEIREEVLPIKKCKESIFRKVINKLKNIFNLN